MKCWIIWCAHPLVRLPLPHICMCVYKQICTVADTHTHTSSTHTKSISYSYTPTWSCSPWSTFIFYLNLYDISYDAILWHEHTHTTHKYKHFHLEVLSIRFPLLPHHHCPCSTQPTHLLLPPTVLDVLAEAFPIKQFYYKPSPFGLDGVSGWVQLFSTADTQYER